MSLRVGIIGARRRSQGIGEHVARHLSAAGAAVVAIVGTRPETLAEAQHNLSERWGLEVAGYTSLAQMLKAEALDAVAICSPQQFHLTHLRECLEAGAHVLCEKPLLFNPPADPAVAAKPIVEGFERVGRLLMVIEQWPYTLPSFKQIYPKHVFEAAAPRELRMWLSPGATGLEMIPSALPHALSLLLALAPTGGEAREISITAVGNALAAEAMEIRFDYVHKEGRTSVHLSLTRVERQPRPAGYAIDGSAIRRVVDTPGYRMFFEPGEVGGATHGADGTFGRVPIPDPLALLAADFVHRCSCGDVGSSGPKLIDSLRILAAVYAAAVEQLSARGPARWTRFTKSTISAAS